MPDDFDLTLDELTKEYERQWRQVREASGRLSEIEITAQSDDEMVTVKVGPRGQVRSIELNPRIYRRLSPSELSHTIMAQITRAAAMAAERYEELMGPLTPDDVPYAELFGEGADLGSLLPAPGVS
ncbi:YbaB/EbfC family nucleoid-associated protein [Streptosporangium sp. KLBMP 9127]|nr:YbaB/EbfC family nucleoid-associated protein [Streptosporangium sp. KLBMP 9127]